MLRVYRGAQVPGGDAGGATPVPIPNTEVKPSRADGTALATVWESRSLPGVNSRGGLRLPSMRLRLPFLTREIGIGE